MTDGNYINIGGVKFNKNDVKSSEKIQKDGYQLNSVFMKDGTKVVFPNQSAKNESVITQKEIIDHHSSGLKLDMDGNIVPSAGTVGGLEIGGYDTKTGEYETEFYRMKSAEITGTDKKDSYTLNGCIDSKVDVSQQDKKQDTVIVKDDDSYTHRSLGINKGKLLEYQNSQKVPYSSEGNEVKLGEKFDQAITKNNEKEHWYQSSKKFTKGPGEVKE